LPSQALSGNFSLIERGLESASTEPLLDHETVMATGRARLRRS
jgi:hypothetical protein